MGSFFSDIELYKRVEVLRGPASGTLYGSGAIGGIINFTTKDASDFLTDGRTQALRFKLGYESNGDAGLASVIFARRMSDSFEMLGALNYRFSDTVQDGDGVAIDGTDYDAPSGLIKGTWTFAEGQTLRLSFQHWVSDEEDAAYAQTGSNMFGNVDRRVTDTTATLVYADAVPESDWLDYTITFGFSDTTNEQLNSDAGIPSPLFADSDYAYRTVSLKAENRVELGGAGWDTFLTFGADVSRVDRKAVTTSGPLGFHPEGTDDKLGLYAQSEFVFGERLTLIPGLRADFVDRRPGASVSGGEAITDTAISPSWWSMF
jgi:hemoglobin/transferrin/lactoferrin receptor protein